jgi:hypothetical protein
MTTDPAARHSLAASRKSICEEPMSLRTRYGRIDGVLMLATLAGCVRSRVTRFDPTYQTEARTPPDQIKFYNDQRPRCPYKEVGAVSAESRFLASWSSVVRKAREKAHEMGGDAIVGVKEKTRISDAVVIDGNGSASEVTALSGTVIRYSQLDCRE